jgi:outer membrane lipoprotein-sorting protein
MQRGMKRLGLQRLFARAFYAGLGAVAACLLGIAPASGQAAQPEKPPMADQVFKNIQVLKGLSVDEFMGTMGFISASLNVNCTACHATDTVERYAEDTPLKQTARRMILMVNTLNKANFQGRPVVTCYSCHRGADRPKVIPSLAEQYGDPPPDDPNEVETLPAGRDSGSPSADQILDRYIQALGGAQRLNSLTSFTAKGTYEGFDTLKDKNPVEVYAKAPNQRTVIVHLPEGDNIRTFDGRTAWTTSAGTLLPLPVLMLTGGELAGARLDAELTFPAKIKQALTGWRADFPATTIDNNDVEVVQGTSVTKTPVKLYFDKKSGLLLRLVRYTNTAIGLNPTQIDYADYRPVAGVKIPFRWTVTWTDGQSTISLTSVQANATVDAGKFARPAPLK